MDTADLINGRAIRVDRPMGGTAINEGKGTALALTSINEVLDKPSMPIMLPSKDIVQLRWRLLQWTKYKPYFIQKLLYMTYGFKYLSFYVINKTFR